MPSERPRRGLSLATKLSATIALLVAAAVGLNGFFSFRTLDELARADAKRRREDGEAAMKAQAELVARNLAATAVLPLAESNYNYIDNVLRAREKEDRRIRWIAVLDPEAEKVLVSRTERAPAGQRIDDALGARLKQEGAEVVFERDPADPTRWTFAASVRANDRNIGQVRLEVSTRELEEALAASIAEARERASASARKQLIVAGVILLAGVLAGAWQALRITRPLQALQRQASHIASGDFDRRVDIRSRDELGQLADSFNTMAEGLKKLLVEMAGKASLERELELARSVQELMSPPPRLITVGPFRLAGVCEPATQCGGDWWTVRQLSGGRLLVVVGDVTGHGMPAAMIAASGRGAVEALAHVDDAHLTPQLVLDAIDNAIRDVGSETLLMTCFAMVLHPRAGVIQFANAGHTFPYVGRLEEASGRLADLGVLAVNGNPLGSMHKVVQAGTRPLRPGTVIVLSTDGLCDRLSPSGERFGEKRLRKVLTGHEPIQGEPVVPLRDLIVREVSSFAGAQPSDDDLTLVVCHFEGLSEEDVQGNVA